MTDHDEQDEKCDCETCQWLAEEEAERRSGTINGTTQTPASPIFAWPETQAVASALFGWLDK